MNQPLKQHLIDPEICIRCYTCEMTCPEQAIEHDDMNVVVDASKCKYCMDCIPVCPTGSIDNWRVVTQPYSLEDQYGWMELPEQQEIAGDEGGLEAMDDAISALLAEAHKGAGGKAKAPATASKPTVSMYGLGRPAEAKVTGNFRLTAEDSDSDVRHIILDFGSLPFPVLEGQSIGIIPLGTDEAGNPHLPRLYSVSSPRDGERPNFNNLSLTVKREEKGLCSNYVCDLKPGDTVQVTGPFGATFLLPADPDAKLLMICTGTGSAPFRAFTMRRQREYPSLKGSLMLVFGARRPRELPYFGPLKKVPEEFMSKHFAFSRQEGEPKHYVQDKLREEAEKVGELLQNPKGHIYICGLKAMEQGVDEAFKDIARGLGLNWAELRDRMREEGRYHVETY
ncbi:benzoyl-CoA oxygenase [Ruegeria marisrubri]|uniref:Benzoyl-CoA oxygenase n=1 Tax=Ruegeria marisrubri TaxID=1685379 RepID=A0A0X3TG14_9RHOB|nr:benzoyl-CoA 2,3-epoxidase subunit BoxA [Ruegeria marisrubri]KUJ73236.1 benzoyl-CoA oxygenase [Ruegeria marisrubri]